MIKTEYSKVKDLFLCYPKGYKDISDNVVSFYQKLIDLIPDNIRQFIIVNNEAAGNEIKMLYPNKDIKIILINGFNEIFLRDLFGYNTGEKRIYRPIFKPDYCNYIYTQDYLDLIEFQVKQIFMRSIRAEVVELPLILDGGNLVTNGEIGFMTDKVIKQNPEVENYIEKIMFDYLGIKAVILPSNKHDKLAHTDGYLNFLSKDNICVSQYPKMDFLKEDINYVTKLTKVMQQHSLNITTILDRPVNEKVIGGGQWLNDKSNNCLNSARGIYTNFLILNDTIILPEYTLPNYKKGLDYNHINQEILKISGYKVISINCNDIAKLGGSLHCISFTN